MKLSGKLDHPEQAVLVKSVKMIVDQVDAMKRLVNEFRDYARLPQALLQPLDLNELLFDVVQFYGASAEDSDTVDPLHRATQLDLHSAGGEATRPLRTHYSWHPSEGSAVHLELDLDPRCGLIRGDALQVRQVIHNLLQNAQDATEGQAQRRLSVSTHSSSRGERVRLVVTDSGAGFPDFILKRAFEPYVTTKAKGTGLGLAVVKKIADDHAARIHLKNLEHNGVIIGAQVSVSFEVAQEQQVEG
jgi:nitrogen fixation/metabolism regulation signal transduction histidine kinase